jgi:hypothetical protein
MPCFSRTRQEIVLKYVIENDGFICTMPIAIILIATTHCRRRKNCSVEPNVFV